MIALATAVVYSNSLQSQFVFDDQTSIADNASIRNLAALDQVLSPPNHGETVTARPMLNLTFAVNYAISGTDVWSYHLGNLIIHMAAAFLLFGILRRTLLLPGMQDRWGRAAIPLAFVVAFLWAVHPLQTESVAYIVQRAESLMGLFYLLTLYCVIRGARSERTATGAISWYLASILACLCGMATKEVMATAPLVVFLYDRAFLAGSFREVCRRRYGLYLAMASTWAILVSLVVSAGSRSNSVGLTEKLSVWAYLCTQGEAIVHYVRLCIWPHPLIFDYGPYIAKDYWTIIPCGLAVLAAVVATLVAMWRWPKASILGVCFFIILAPTSSVLPVCVTQTMSEHRMYLPSAAVLTGLVLGGFSACQYAINHRRVATQNLWMGSGAAVAAIGLLFGWLTFQRNLDYRDETAIWRDTAEKMPDNARAHSNLGAALSDAGQVEEAIRQCHLALKIKPEYGEAYYNLANSLYRGGNVPSAIADYEKAIACAPSLALAYYNLGIALAKQGKLDEAIARYEKAIELNDTFSEAYTNLGNALARQGKLADAIARYRRALSLRPDVAKTESNLGNALCECGQYAEALTHYEKAITLQPNLTDARYNCAIALTSLSRFSEAVIQYRDILTRQPERMDARYRLAMLLAACPEAAIRNGAESIALAQPLVDRVRPQDPRMLDLLAAGHAEAGRFPEAIRLASEAARLASQSNNIALAEAIHSRLRLYESRTPFRGSLLVSPAVPAQQNPSQDRY